MDGKAAGTARDGRRTDHIQSVARAVAILEIISDNASGITARELSRQAGLNISTCHHIVSTLAMQGFVRISQQHIYTPGIKLSELHWKYIQGTSMVQRVRHLLEDVVSVVGETAYLATWKDGKAVLLDAVDAPGGTSLSELQPGYFGAAHARASGKVLLAELSEEQLESYLRFNPLIARTPRTITSKEDLLAELAKTRLLGYGLDDEEYAQGLRCVAVPIRGRANATMATLSVSWFVSRDVNMESVVAEILRVARVAPAMLGDFLF